MKFLKDWPVAVALVLVGTALYAQPTTDGEAPKETAPTPAPSAENLSVGEMSARTEALAAESKDTLRHVLYLQQLARKQQDVIKLNCVNDRFVTLKATTNLFDITRSELTVLVASDNPERHEVFGKLTGQAAAIEKIRQEADGCVGQELGIEDTTTTATHPPFPDDPTADDPLSGLIEPPAYASPFN